MKGDATLMRSRGTHSFGSKALSLADPRGTTAHTRDGNSARPGIVDGEEVTPMSPLVNRVHT